MRNIRALSISEGLTEVKNTKFSKLDYVPPMLYQQFQLNEIIQQKQFGGPDNGFTDSPPS